MSERLWYSDSEVALISGVIVDFHRSLSVELRKTYEETFLHLQAGITNAADLSRIKKLMELAKSSQCDGYRKESVRLYESVILKTRAMLRATKGAEIPVPVMS